MSPSYSEVYNSFYPLVSSTRDTVEYTSCCKRRRVGVAHDDDVIHAWVTTLLLARTRPTRLHLLRHLTRLVDTQSLAHHVPSHTREHIARAHTLSNLGFVIFVLRPLQRRVLDRLWRPGGLMYRLNMDDALRSTRGVSYPRVAP